MEHILIGPVLLIGELKIILISDDKDEVERNIKKYVKKPPLPTPKRKADKIQAYSSFEKKISNAKMIIDAPLVLLLIIW